jgi:hypothetical protein
LTAVVESDLAAENPLIGELERLPVHPTALVVFGATGDLSRRKLLPAVYNLAHEGALPERFELVGVARSEQSDEDFREMAREAIERFSRRPPDRYVLAGMRYLPGTFDDDGVYGELDRTLDDIDSDSGVELDRLFYLATAPQFFPVICAKLGAAGLDRSEAAETRIVIEKPFGHDLASARELNACVLGRSAADLAAVPQVAARRAAAPPPRELQRPVGRTRRARSRRFRARRRAARAGPDARAPRRSRATRATGSLRGSPPTTRSRWAPTDA